ncbi:MAG: tetratricopeptide repeat protein, partial [bacterium]|nr:tetratricopeptide repeat protein [bacterium]
MGKNGFFILLSCLFLFCSFSLAESDIRISSVEEVIQAYHRLMAEGQKEKAARIIDKSLKIIKSNPILLSAKAESLFLSGDLEKSEELCDYILSRLDSEYDWPMLTLAKIYTAQKRYDEAYSLLGKLEKKKETYEIHLLRAQALSGEGRYREADPEFLRAIEMKPDDAYLHEMRAWNLKNYDIEEAEKIFRKLIGSDPGNSGIIAALSEIGSEKDRRQKEFEEKQFDEISLRYRDELRSDKGVVILAQKADAFFQQEEYRESEYLCKYILSRLDSEYDWPMLTLAKIYTAQKRYDEAYSLLGKLEKKKE